MLHPARSKAKLRVVADVRRKQGKREERAEGGIIYRDLLEGTTRVPCGFTSGLGRPGASASGLGVELNQFELILN